MPDTTTPASAAVSASLDSFFSPRSIAIVGASASAGKIGAIPLRYQLECGYQGKVYPINPARAEVQGVRAWPSLRAVEAPIDLAVFAVPSAQVDGALDDAIAAGVRNIVLFSAGYAEVGADGAAMQRRLADKARAAGIRLLGPNCLGFMNVAQDVYATFSPVVGAGKARAGSIAIVSQSGAFGAYAYALARERGLGLSWWATTGNEADIQVADCIVWLAADPATRVILAYLEGCRDGERLKAALALARAHGKPVVAVKVGRTGLGAAAAASHTASLAGDDAVYDALFRQYGVWRAHGIEEFFSIGYALSVGRLPPNDKLGLLTVSGGVGALMADDAADAGLDVAPMPEAAQRWLTERVPFAAPRNPVDVTGQVTSDPGLLEATAQRMLGDGGYGSLLVFLAAGGLSPSMAPVQTRMAAALRAAWPDRLIVFSTLSHAPLRAELDALGCPSFDEPGRAVRVVAALNHFRRHLGSGAAAPAPTPVLPALALARGTQNEADSMALLGAHGLPCVPCRAALDADAAVAAAEALGYPVALKVLSRDILHKSDIGGVALGLADAGAVRAACARLQDNLARHAPQAVREGFLVARMAARGGIECILGAHRDPVLGPVVMFGLGGVNVEVFQDVSFRLAPVDRAGALEMIGALRAAPLLRGHRGQPPADLDALADAIAALSRLAAAAGDSLESIDINPLLAYPAGAGALALDAVVTGTAATAGPAA